MKHGKPSGWVKKKDNPETDILDAWLMSRRREGKGGRVGKE